MLNIFLEILVIVLSIVAIIIIGGIIYLISKGLIFKWFYHNILEWHLPDDESLGFDGCSFHAHCKICNKEIMMDSQGNWF